VVAADPAALHPLVAVGRPARARAHGRRTNREVDDVGIEVNEAAALLVDGSGHGRVDGDEAGLKRHRWTGGRSPPNLAVGGHAHQVREDDVGRHPAVALARIDHVQPVRERLAFGEGRVEHNR
jgi:hypothetical protein